MLTPFEGNITPFQGKITPFQGKIAPFEGKIAPFQGEIFTQKMPQTHDTIELLKKVIHITNCLIYLSYLIN